jgi:hypothetical protein
MFMLIAMVYYMPGLVPGCRFSAVLYRTLDIVLATRMQVGHLDDLRVSQVRRGQCRYLPPATRVTSVGPRQNQLQ